MMNQTHSRYCAHHDNGHVNAFVDLNSIPYILGEYLDRRTFREVDRSAIKSEINVDTSEAMRAVIDINIDDIGKRASDGFPSVLGNSTKFQNLLRMIGDYVAGGYNRQLNILRKGIVIRVNYQLENITTGHVIRSMSEDFRINNRGYFIDINPKDINDNAIIINFSDTMVSAVDQFTHGIDRMGVRVTSLQMFYEVVQRKVCSPTIKNMGSCHHHLLPTVYGNEEDMYTYHSKMQSHQYLGYPSGYDHCPSSVIPPSWVAFNTFYHFDECNGDIILHQQEIDDPRYQVSLIAAGTVSINRSFVINPASRLIFKLNIWKNDLTVVNNAIPIAQILQIPIIGHHCGDSNNDCNCDHHHHYHDGTIGDHCKPPINPDQETLIRLYRELQIVNDRQNGMINYLMTRIDSIDEKLSSMLPPVEEDPGNNNEVPTPTPGDDNKEPTGSDENQENKDPENSSNPSEIPSNESTITPEDTTNE